MQDFNFAARIKGVGNLSTQFLLTPDPNVTYSACLMHKVEQMFSAGIAPYPVERTLLTSGMLEACRTSKKEGNRWVETPYLNVHYQPPQASQYCRS